MTLPFVLTAESAIVGNPPDPLKQPSPSGVYQAFEEVGDYLEGRKTISATSYTLLEEDNGAVLDFTAATAVTVTVPTGLSEKFICALSQGGLGQVTVAPISGSVSINEIDGSFATEGRYAVLGLAAFGLNTYRLFGRTA